MAKLSGQLKKDLADVEDQLYSLKRGDSSYSNGQPSDPADRARLEGEQQELIRRIADAESKGE